MASDGAPLGRRVPATRLQPLRHRSARRMICTTCGDHKAEASYHSGKVFYDHICWRCFYRFKLEDWERGCRESEKRAGLTVRPDAV